MVLFTPRAFSHEVAFACGGVLRVLLARVTSLILCIVYTFQLSKHFLGKCVSDQPAMYDLFCAILNLSCNLGEQGQQGQGH